MTSVSHPCLLTSSSILKKSRKKVMQSTPMLIKSADMFLLKLHSEGKSIKYIAAKMGRSQTAIVMRLGKLNSSI